MKKLLLIGTVLAFTFVAAAHAAEKLDFEKSPNFKKLDGRARMAWIAGMKNGGDKKELDCLIKVAAKMTPEQKSKLVGAGYKPGTIIDTIVTGKAPVNKVPAIAALDFVKALELAVPLNLKEGPPAAKPASSVTKPVANEPVKIPVLGASAAKPAEQTTVVAKTAQTSSPPLSPANMPPSASPVKEENYPIYQSGPTPAPVVDVPNQPPTSDAVPMGPPSVTPVDQGVPTVKPLITFPNKTSPPAPAPTPVAPAPQPATPVVAPSAPAAPLPVAPAPKTQYAPAK